MKVCEICRASSESLLEFNGVLSCTACFKSKIQSMVGVVKR
ncbi:MAG: hypothetical protein ACREAW_00850 [Nitrososphaera sp.]